ncbi:hypothetical protein WJX72_009436 [[Myrmecia] bisecta]|uniref:isoamylase n=1 Tax=[Myrmecia] bisecta TaxID=41462 RepID=A0AAW1QRV6_9CHLO
MASGLAGATLSAAFHPGVARAFGSRGPLLRRGWPRAHASTGSHVVHAQAATSTLPVSSRAWLTNRLPSSQADLDLDRTKPQKGSPLPGFPEPLGASLSCTGDAVNFAVYAANATGMTLCLFTEDDLAKGRTTLEYTLNPVKNRTGDVWHMRLMGVDLSLLYGYRAYGAHQDVDDNSNGHRYLKETVLLDPYAQAAIGRRSFGELGPDLPYQSGEVLGLARTWPQFGGVLPRPELNFDWQGDRPLHLPLEDLVIYEMHVRGFTQHRSGATNSPGTYLGVVEKLDYLKALGVNAIELLPVQEFNELEYYTLIPGSDEYRFNFWGYSTVAFFAPMARYSQAAQEGQPGQSVINEFKLLVRECHARGIEVILDVVFNHTAEGNEMGPSLSFRGLDNRVYYMLAPGGEYYNYSGCGNTFNCNHPVVRRFIVDCLRYWVQEMHVDGFRFDLASILTRAHSTWHPPQPAVHSAAASAVHSDGAPPEQQGLMAEGAGVPTGTPLSEPALVEMISEDPVLRHTKLIAEAWDCDGLNQVGAFPHFGGRWAEWNGHFRDTARQFVKGTEGPWVSNFASAICGSPHIYAAAEAGEEDWWGSHGGRRWRGSRQPLHSVNFITAHDGFTMADLVAYNEKHNEANGEENRDGEQHNLSWNCGEEGDTQVRAVQLLRARQMRNLAAALLLAHGVPMVQMGDEYGHSKGGNNNTYCHDSELNWFNWEQATADKFGFARFFRCLVHFRRARPELRRSRYLAGDDITWHGALVGEPDWSDTSRLLAFTLSNGAGGGLYVAFNSSHQAQVLQLPAWEGRTWQTVLDTGKVAPYDFLQADDVLSAEQVAATRRELHMWTASNLYAVLSYSCVVLESVPDPSTSMLPLDSSSRATSSSTARQAAGLPTDSCLPVAAHAPGATAAANGQNPTMREASASGQASAGAQPEDQARMLATARRLAANILQHRQRAQQVPPSDSGHPRRECGNTSEEHDLPVPASA